MRRLLKSRFLLPGSLMVMVGLGTLVALGTGANASSNSGLGAGLSTGGGSNAGNFNQGTSVSGAGSSPSYLGGPQNSGGANSTIRHYVITNGKKILVAYGDSAILYKQPPASLIPQGEALFAENCASCHGGGSQAAEGSAIAPNLRVVGPATVDFWVSSGRMPATNTNLVEAERKPARLSTEQALAVAAYVNSLNPSVPFIPYPNLRGANIADGAYLFSLNCAACHTITGFGDALAFGTNAPSLNDKAVTPQQVAEAIRTGPANMPRFSGNLDDSQVRDLVAYVTEDIQHPDNPGGFGLGGVGPVAEGFVALLIGVGGFALICFWIGDRSAP
jgi:ubiquinol-cytochrome c reductase cytochrome c subunit